ncbi:Fe-S cluster assembly protein SufD [Falsarthrobacter nasiphocae]|uniref:Fe-S cluster assembly protein SufD n=1 Tax=Falsarthrobacter nasiphocae TaxID=189863 RepID=A0AAE3YFM4_9MICC|nr:Fe-S cluster assembly protein SufD [Falsarthrobacter nasiphocae]MDR6891146.1 Fe-S cluster assembly protein SufD [Falsarthrobacter nasiphocae]
MTSESKTVDTGEGRVAIEGMDLEGEHLATDGGGTEQHGARAHSDGRGVTKPEGSRGERATSFDIADFPIPGGREEEWRFTPVERLGALFAADAESGRLTRDFELPEGVTEREITADEMREIVSMEPADRLAAAAVANAPSSLLVDVPAEAELTEPIRLRLTGEGGAPVFDHLVIRVGRFAKALVILEHEGTAEVTSLVSVVTGDGSDVRVVSAQLWEDTAIHAAQHDALVGRDAVYKHVAVSLGGGLVRLNANVRYAGPGGDASMYGLYFADAGQHLEHRSFVDHNVENCASNVLYKGALQGKDARTVWVGDVLIRKAAEGTDSYEKNQNLVLTDGARADSVPNLEIETGLIEGAGHASSTGRFDDEHLFYLMARGIPEKEARRLVVRGFLNEIIQKIGDDSLEERLRDAVEAELAATEI